jgi:hypothetical protein
MRCLIPAVIAMVWLAGSVSAAPILIDNFATPNPQVQINGPGAVNLVHSGAGIFGTRTVTTSPNLAAGDTFRIGQGIVNIQTGATSSVQTNLSYAFATQNFSKDAGIILEFGALDAGTGVTSAEIRAVLNTSTGNLSASVILFDSIVPVSGFLPFNTFTGPGNLSNVTGAQFFLNDTGTPNPGTDFELRSIRVTDTGIPEPGSLAVWGLLGAAGVWYGRRRFRTAQANA